VTTTNRRTRGQALPEFALVLPLILLMTIGAIDLGRVLWALDSISNAAREGARHAIVHGGTKGLHPDGCSFGPGATPPSTCKTVDQVVRDNALGAGGAVTVTVCYGLDCLGNTNTTGATNARGTPITVSVTSRINLITPSLLGMSGFGVSSSTTMVVNH